jgi:hypothetical protein
MPAGLSRFAMEHCVGLPLHYLFGRIPVASSD